MPGNADAIQIKIDPSVQFVTPTDLGNALTAHVAEDDPHQQYQTKVLAASQAVAEKKYADSLQNQKKLFDVSGTADAIVLTSKTGATPITELTDFDELSFIVSATNTDVVTISIDGLGAVPLSGVVSDTQIFATALLTVRYIAGSLYIVSQINPKTGNSVLDIAKLYTDTVDVLAPGEYALDGSEINSFDHPIACAKAAASSNYIAQSTKDNDPIAYGGYYGFVDELDGSTTVTLPMMGGEFIRMFDDGRGVDSGRGFAEWKTHSLENHVHSHYDGQGVVQEYQLTAGNSGIYTSTYGPAATVPNSLNTGAVQTGNVGFETRPRSIAYYGKTRL